MSLERNKETKKMKNMSLERKKERNKERKK